MIPIAMTILVLGLAGIGPLLAREGIAKTISDRHGSLDHSTPERDASSTPSPDEQATSTPTTTPTNWLEEMVVRGVAVDASSAVTTTVPDARVFVHVPSARCEPATRTDAQGRFSRSCYDIYFEAALEVHVVADGYAPWVIQRGGPYPEIELLARLEPHPREGGTPTPTPADDLRYIVIEGTVRREQDRAPIEAARIWATPSPGHCLSPVYSGPDGRYELVCPRLNYIGTLTLLAEKPGFLNWTRQMRGSEAGTVRWGIEMASVTMTPTPTRTTTSRAVPPSRTPTPAIPTQTAVPEILLLPDLRR